jgi:hypothetical protein
MVGALQKSVEGSGRRLLRKKLLGSVAGPDSPETAVLALMTALGRSARKSPLVSTFHLDFFPDRDAPNQPEPSPSSEQGVGQTRSNYYAEVAESAEQLASWVMQTKRS